MVLISDGNSEHVAHAWTKKVFSDKKKYLICDCSRSHGLIRSNNRDCSLRAHLHLSYHLISVP